MNRLFASVKTRLTLAVALIVLFYTAVLLVLTYGLMRDMAERNSAELADTVLEEADTHISRFFRNMEEIALAMAAYSPVYTEDIPRLRELILTNVRARRSYMRAIYLGTEEGNMYEWGYGEGFVDNMPVFAPGYDPRVRPWYRDALAADGFAVTDPYLYASIDDYGITCVLPVYHPDTARLIGVLGVDIMLDALQNLVEEFEISMGGKVLLLDRSGNPIVDQFDSSPTGELRASIRDEVLQSRAGRFIAASKGVPHFFSYKENPVTEWMIFVGLPLPAIMAPAYDGIRLSVMLYFFLMVLLLITLEWFVRRMVVEPVEVMVGTIERMKSGDADIRITLKRKDEFGLLAGSFNGLADRVQEYAREMERKVRERTETLHLLQQENLRLRIIEEKERIYGYLHDSLGSRLTNIFISNNVARSASSGDPAVLRDMLDRIEENVQAGLDDLKEILSSSMEFNRKMIDFSVVLELQVRRRLELKDVHFSFTGNIADLNDLSRTVAVEVEKLLQELVSNVLKHAEARNVYLVSTVSEEQLRLVFRDDGCGFDPESVPSDSFGLAGIRRRLECRGATLDIRTHPGEGTEVAIDIPLAAGDCEDTDE